jgi:tetratricopeptide (TPR) repeat protein
MPYRATLPVRSKRGAVHILLVQGLPPESEYRFKHALIQDAAYENLLRSRRQVLHRRIGEVLRDQFAATTAAEPELLAHHFTQSGLIEVAIEWWGKAGRHSLERSALVEATAQLTRALDQIAALPPNPALRHEQIKLQVALLTPLIHVRGYAAPETKTAAERARVLIEQAEALGEPPEDPLLLYSILYGFWVANLFSFNGDLLRELATQFLALAEKQGASVPLMIGHRLMGVSLLFMGDFAESRAHLDRAFALYNPAEHCALATRFGSEPGVTILSWRSWPVWCLGYPEAAVRDADHALREARKLGQAATSMVALVCAAYPNVFCGNYAAASTLLDEFVALADEKGAAWWKAVGMLLRGGAVWTSWSGCGAWASGSMRRQSARTR